MNQGIIFAVIAAWLFPITVEGQTQQAKDESPTSPISAIRARLREELLQQRAAWQKLEASQHPVLTGAQSLEPNRARFANATGCYDGIFYASYEDRLAERSYPRPTRIPSATAWHGACPFWIPQQVRGRLGSTHEYTGHNPTPAQQVPFSDELIGSLASEAHRSRENIWAISQFTRVLVENQQFDRARVALNSCAVDETWCAMLRIHVEQEAGEYHAADSLSKSLLRYLPEELRQRLLDPSILFYLQEARSYSSADRERAASNVWWLAQPFFSDGANVRRSEHLSRSVRNTLAQQMELDVFYHTSPTVGGDAVQAMRQKYGWATHHAWVGQAEDDRVGKITTMSPPPPYSAPEYSWPRTATLPRMRAVVDPLSVTDDDFELGPPDSITYFRWWPAEFFQHKHGLILPFLSQQKVILPRDSGMLVFVATDLKGNSKPVLLDSIGDAPVRGELWFSPAPDSAYRVYHTTAKRGDRLVLHSEFREPGIVGAEYRVNANGLAGGRSRFGIKTVRTLSSIPPGTCELSVPMLLDASMLPASGPAPLDKALLGNLSLRNPSNVGIAWESYGFVPGDTTTVAVHIERIVDVGRMQRVGIALGVVEDPSVSAGIRWTEPDGARSSISLETSVPVVQRHINLGIRTLRAGEYLLQIEMQNARCGKVSSEQRITVLR